MFGPPGSGKSDFIGIILKLAFGNAFQTFQTPNLTDRKTMLMISKSRVCLFDETYLDKKVMYNI